MVSLILGDCLEKMKEMESNSVDSIVTDPPYGISFMGKKWDYDIPSVDVWKECLRILKPGGHLLSFGGSRTFHRIAVNIEDAGFELRDTLMWIYGSGFPKSHNIGKAIDKKLGNEREPYERPDFVSRSNKKEQPKSQCINGQKGLYTIGTSEWEGWGTALKPAHEPIIMARKPFKGDVASNVLKYGTGGINIDDCRVETNDDFSNVKPRDVTKLNTKRNDETEEEAILRKKNGNESVEEAMEKLQTLGRWPANVLHDGSDEVVELFPDTGGGTYRFNPTRKRANTPFFEEKDVDCSPRNAPDSYGDKGTAARYFYCPKASKKDRNEGCEDLEEKFKKQNGSHNGKVDTDDLSSRWQNNAKNNHPTVKPTELMRYLCRLVTPQNGIVLDPFMGSASTGKAALLEGFSFIGIEMDEEYFEIAKRRAKDG